MKNRRILVRPFHAVMLLIALCIEAIVSSPAAVAQGAPKQANAPVITEGDVVAVSMSEDGAPTAFSLTLNATDADMDALTWSIASPASNGTATAASANTTATIGYAPTNNFNGSDSFGVQVDDGNGGTDLIIVNVTVTPESDPPAITPIGAQVVGENEVLLFVVSAPDPDGETAVLSVSSLPDGASFDSATGAFSWTPDFDAAGVYEGIVFTAVDGGDDTVMVTETIRITVNDTNRAPLLNAVSNREVREERTLTLTLSGSDPDGNALTFFMEMLPENATFNTASATLSFTPALGAAGDYAVLAGVRDNGAPSASATQAFVITVTERDLGAELEEIAETLLDGIGTGDTDGNGFFDFTEAEALVSGLLQSRFDGLDTNNDGFLSRNELLNAALRSDEALESVAQTLLSGFAGGDADKDGMLSETEAIAVTSALTSQQFAAIDADDDGFLTEVEISTVATARARRLEESAERLLLFFGAADLDDSGTLNRAEIEAAIPDLFLGDFESLDLNLNDQVSEAELNTTALTGDSALESAAELIMEFFYDADTNMDGRVSREEAVRGISTLTLRDFMELDLDSDGLLSREEVSVVAATGDRDLELAAEALLAAFATADTNNNNALSRDEALTVVPELTLAQFNELDSNGNGSLSEAEVATAAGLNDPVPMTPVIVEGVVVGGTTETSALVYWKTQVDSVATVRFGTSADALSQSAASSTASGIHEVTLDGLTASTTYFLRVDSVNPGDIALASTSRIYSFTTRSTPDTSEPVFVAPPVVAALSDTSVLLSWGTNEFAFGEVLLSDATGNRTYEPPMASREQSVVIENLTPATDYALLLSAVDTSGNRATVMLDLRTLATPYLAPARIVDGVLVTHVSDTSISLRWATDIPASTEVAFSEDDTLSLVQTLPGLRRDHYITVVGLTAETAYRIEARSTDMLGNGVARGGAQTVTTFAVTPADPLFITAAPRIIATTDTSAIVYWKTSIPSDSTVSFGITDATSRIQSSSSYVLDHQIVLTGLQPGTGYRFSCRSTTLDGSTVTATTVAEPGLDSDTILYFTTSATPDVVAPQITTGPEVLGITDEGFTVRWTTDEPADSYVRYGLEAGIVRLDFQDNRYTTNHLVTIRGLAPESDYQLIVNTADPSGNGPASSAPISLTTVASLDSTGPQFRAEPTASSVLSTSAVIRWSTNEISSGQLTLIVAPNETHSIRSVALPATAQSLVLGNLLPNTTYGFVVRAIDQNQNETVSTTGQFTTAVARLTVSPTRLFLTAGDTRRLTVTSEDPNENSFQFVSENSAIASVSTTGLVTAEAPGSTRILVADTAGVRVVTVPVSVSASNVSEDLSGFFTLLGIFLLQNGESGTIGPCFIATAAAGTPLAPEIDVLRRFRDDYLLSNGFGTMFVDTYYTLSPPLADWIALHPAAALVVRILLIPVLLLIGVWMQSPLLTMVLILLSGWSLRRVGQRLRRT